MGAPGFQLCWASRALIFWSRKLWGKLGRTLSWEIEAQALFLRVSVTSLIYKVTGKSCRAGTSSSECRLLSPVLSPCHFWLIALHHSSKDQSHPTWPRSRCLLGLQWCPLFVDLGSQACLGFASKKKKIKRYILGDDICTVTGELGQEKATSRLTFEKKLLGRERLETIRHLSYIQETNEACSRKTCDKQKWERQALCKWPIRVPETHGPALSECRPFPGD